MDPRAVPADFRRPGHVFPLRAHPDGVLGRRGHTEAAVDLARLAGLFPAGVICEVLDTDGSPARGPRLRAVAEEHGMPMISVAQLVAYRQRAVPRVRRLSAADLPTPFGAFRAVAYSGTDGEHVALVRGDPAAEAAPLVRVHSECLTGDIFASLRCDCGLQLRAALRRIAQEGAGVLVYLRGHEGWAKDYWERLHPTSAGSAYVNFMMDEGEDRVRATYRDNYERLARIKRRYDPDSTFHINQNIRPADQT